jgi:YidC/Oxa1 family membrane protein insertase
MGIHPLKSFISPVIFIPIWWSLIHAIREFLVYFPSLKNSGILWFPNLTVPDPYYLLPVLWITILAFNIWVCEVRHNNNTSIAHYIMS